MPVNFGTVTGAFNIDHCGLSSLEGCPNTVGASFVCRRNNITSLQGGPLVVKGNYNCSDNNLKSLEGSPTNIGGNFILDWNSELPMLRLLMYNQYQIVIKRGMESPGDLLKQYDMVAVYISNIIAC